MTRHQLEDGIKSWLNRVGFRSPVANFDAVGAWIALAEEDINKRLRIREMISRVTQPIEGQYTTLPCDWLQMFDVRLQNGPELLYQPRADLANIHWGHWQQAPGDPAWSGYAVPAIPWNAGQPVYYSIVGQQMELMPFPEDPDVAAVIPDLELAYYQRQTLGSGASDTTTVLTVKPSLYIYGSLLHAAPYLRDDPRMQTWASYYESGIESANAEAEAVRTQGSRLQARYRRLA